MRFCCIRPENVRLLQEGEAGPEALNLLTGRLRRIVNLGAQVELFVEVCPDLTVTAVVRSTLAERLPMLGESVRLAIAPEDVQLLAR